MRAVHPRWRGEHVRTRLVLFLISGSSPLARGTLESSAEGSINNRFIPAGAGNT